jgi:hypothetical protein
VGGEGKAGRQSVEGSRFTNLSEATEFDGGSGSGTSANCRFEPSTHSRLTHGFERATSP